MGEPWIVYHILAKDWQLYRKWWDCLSHHARVKLQKDDEQKNSVIRFNQRVATIYPSIHIESNLLVSVRQTKESERSLMTFKNFQKSLRPLNTQSFHPIQSTHRDEMAFFYFLSFLVEIYLASKPDSPEFPNSLRPLAPFLERQSGFGRGWWW